MLTPAQLSLLIEGIDWRAPERVGGRPWRANRTTSARKPAEKLAFPNQRFGVESAMRLDLDNLPSDTALAASSGARHGGRSSSTATARSSGSSRSSRSCSERSSAGAPNGSMPISWRSGLKISTPTSPASRGEPARVDRSRAADTAHGASRCPSICRARSVLLDIDGEGLRAAAAARCMPIGESVSEMLDWVPAQLARASASVAPNTPAATCETVMQAPAPERPIAGGLATPALLAHVLVSKYCDHLPLYRQSQIFARHGVDLERSTLAGLGWRRVLVARGAAGDGWRKNVFASDHLFADDTPLPVLDPGRGRTKTGRLWVYARDDGLERDPIRRRRSISTRPTAKPSARSRI